MKRSLIRLHRRLVLTPVRFFLKRWNERGLVLLLALLIGAVTALAAALLHTLVTRLEALSLWVTQAAGSVSGDLWMALLFILPLAGLSLSYLVQRYMGGPHYAKSLSPLILNLNRKKTNIPAVEMFNHMLSSALSVGCGGSAGLEAPSVLTGAAIGANGTSFFHIDRRHRPLLVGCGAAAAISAIFDSPIAGVLFAAEVLLPEFSVAALVPMMMSSAVAAVISRLVMSEEGIFTLTLQAPWQTKAVPFYFLLGIVAALVGVFVIRAAYRRSGDLKRRFRNPWSRLLAGGSALCILLILFPSLRGQGYLMIEMLFSGNTDELLKTSPLLHWIPSPALLLVLLIFAGIFVKLIVSVLTVDSGGDGGIFAPSMFIGAFTGFGFARLVNLTGLVALQEFNFIAVGMCGVFTAVMRAPLTGIFLIAEVTGGYRLLVPLMIVSSVSWFVARLFEPNSIYRKALADSNLLDDDRDRTMLRRIPVRLCFSRGFVSLKPQDPLAEVSKLVERTPQEVFPVLDEGGKLLGVVRLEKILSVMLNPKVYPLLVAFDLMESPDGMVTPDNDLAQAMANFEKFDLTHLPVCDASGEFQGFLARETIFSRYRRMVKEADAF